MPIYEYECLNCGKMHEAVLEGEKAAIEALPKILDIISKLRLEGRLN